LEHHLVAGTRIDAKLARLCAGISGLAAELPREFALRIVRATDKRAEASKLQAETTRAAGRTFARIGAGFSGGRKDVRTEDLVEVGDDLADLQILRLADCGREIAPEIAQQILPRQVAGGDFIELLFEIGSEAVLDIAPEEARQER